MKGLATLPTNLGSWTEVRTALGVLHVATLGDAVVRTALPGTSREEFLDGLDEHFPGTQFQEDPHHPILQQARRELEEYARGQRTEFMVPVLPHGTEFQQAVWNSLSNIPFGQVRTYAEVARDVGSPRASRAVGQANNRNPVAPFVPCHRVVAASGGLGGYGGGVELKQRMLEIEGVRLD